MSDTPTRVRAASGSAHSLVGIGGDDPDHPSTVAGDGGTLACEGSLDVFKKFRYKPRYCTAAGGLFKIYGSRGPGSPPKKTVSIGTMTWSTDNIATQPLASDRRLTVDTGAEIVVLRAASVSDRNQWIRAFEREQSLILPDSSGDSVGLARTTSIPWRLEIGDYLLAGNPIGAGGFGNVIQGMHRRTHRRIAAKVLRLDSRVVKTEAVESEIATMGALKHKNVVELLEVIYVDDNIVSPFHNFLAALFHDSSCITVLSGASWLRDGWVRSVGLFDHGAGVRGRALFKSSGRGAVA